MRFLQFHRFTKRPKGEPPAANAKPFDFLYREAYASGIAFAPSMLDTLLYQAHFKNHEGFVSIVKQLLGVEVNKDGLHPGGLMCQVKVTDAILEKLGEMDYNSLW